MCIRDRSPGIDHRVARETFTTDKDTLLSQTSLRYKTVGLGSPRDSDDNIWMENSVGNGNWASAPDDTNLGLHPGASRTARTNTDTAKKPFPETDQQPRIQHILRESLRAWAIPHETQRPSSKDHANARVGMASTCTKSTSVSMSQHGKPQNVSMRHTLASICLATTLRRRGALLSGNVAVPTRTPTPGHHSRTRRRK